MSTNIKKRKFAGEYRHGSNHSQVENRNKGKVCYRCGRTGHIRRECRSKSSLHHRKQPNAQAHDAEVLSAEIMLSEADGGISNWYTLDSGATHTFLADKSAFVHYKKTKQEIPVVLAGGQHLRAVGRGEVQLI